MCYCNNYNILKVIALDLEGTLISNAVSQIPRPCLFEFIESCGEICKRIVIFTTVREAIFRAIASLLVDEGYAPEWFKNIEYVNWSGKTKNLNFIPNSSPEESVLVDDCYVYVHPGQENRWVEVKQFAHPYNIADVELKRVLHLLRSMMIL